jgi:hypothetical protein
MGWFERWREARAEAAVRRQLAALEGCRGIDSIDVQPVVDLGLPPVDVADRSTWPADYDDGPAPWPRRAELAADGRRMPLRPDAEPVVRVFGVNTVDRLLAECQRADAIAGRHGGFVTTARIRELLGGGGG